MDMDGYGLMWIDMDVCGLTMYGYGYMDIWRCIFDDWVQLAGRAVALSASDPPSTAYLWRAPPLELPIDLVDIPWVGFFV